MYFTAGELIKTESACCTLISYNILLPQCSCHKKYELSRALSLECTRHIRNLMKHCCRLGGWEVGSLALTGILICHTVASLEHFLLLLTHLIKRTNTNYALICLSILSDIPVCSTLPRASSD